MAAVKARETQVTEHRKGEFVISTDKERIDLGCRPRFFDGVLLGQGNLRARLWPASIGNSLCFGVYGDGKQVGFARVISDYATYAYIADVFVLESYRGDGLGKWLMECIISHPCLQGLRRWSLATDGCSRPLRPMGIYSSEDAREIYGAAQPRRLQA